MVCIPCLLLPLAGLLVVLFDFVKPFLIKMGLMKPQQKSEEPKTGDQNKVHDTSLSEKVKQT